MDAFALKAIATLCMLTDHVGAVFPESTPFIFRCIGRISFPIYACMAAYGCARTGSIDRYMLRLGAFALISEIPFDAAFAAYHGYGGPAVDFLGDTNVFYSLFLGVAGVNVYERARSRLSRSALGRRPAGWLACALIAFIPTLPVIALGDVLTTDYGSFAPAFILAMHLAKPKAARLAVMSCGALFLYGSFIIQPGPDDFYSALLLIFALAAVALMALYNGRQGIRLKWAFYGFYPAHIAALALVKAFI
ncbi:MAG: conjugal transfer protein TraX [Clostridiales Family XIII bacterium]|jgi:hypothetical protein|nr:conjugal transfer protein TraX [Clostridiales Family XIII bacterium]